MQGKFKTVKIIRLNHQGQGYFINNGKRCYVDGALPDDVINVEFISSNRAKIIEVIESTSRIQPFCPYHKNCGGCSLQYLSEENYYNFKKRVLKECLDKSGYNIDEKDIKLFTVGAGQRRRASFKWSKNAFGFYEKSSHNIIALEECPNLTPAINDVLRYFKNFRFKNLISMDVLEADNGLCLNFTFRDSSIDFANLNRIDNKNIILITYVFAEKQEPITFRKTTDPFVVFGRTPVVIQNNIFLQATKKSQDFMIDFVVNKLKGSKHIVDLYGGIGTYSFPLAENCRVDSYDGIESMTRIVNAEARKHKLPLTAYTRDLLNNPLRELEGFDACVINPPRNGAENQAKLLAKSPIPKIVFICCNPDYLPRDLKYFNARYRLEDVVLVDQFYRSPHQEVLLFFTLI